MKIHFIIHSTPLTFHSVQILGNIPLQTTTVITNNEGTASGSTEYLVLSETKIQIAHVHDGALTTESNVSPSKINATVDFLNTNFYQEEIIDSTLKDL